MEPTSLNTEGEEMTGMSRIRQEIERWQRQSDAEFDKRVDAQGEHTNADLPDTLAQAVADYERGIHERNQLPVGMLLDTISVNHLGDRPATKYQLMVVAEIGYELFRAAIFHPDATDEVLTEAREQFNGVVDVTLNEPGVEYDRRDPATGEMVRHSTDGPAHLPVRRL